MLRIIEADAPSHWASALINGDWTGLDSDESLLVARFVKESLDGNWPVSCEDAGFKRVHDASRLGVLACDCQTYTALSHA